MDINYVINDDVNNTIKEIYNKIISLGLDNVKFNLIDAKLGDITISLDEYNPYWELTVVNNRLSCGMFFNYVDTYRIKKNDEFKLIHIESFKELL